MNWAALKKNCGGCSTTIPYAWCATSLASKATLELDCSLPRSWLFLTLLLVHLLLWTLKIRFPQGLVLDCFLFYVYISLVDFTSFRALNVSLEANDSEYLSPELLHLTSHCLCHMWCQCRKSIIRTMPQPELLIFSFQTCFISTEGNSFFPGLSRKTRVSCTLPFLHNQYLMLKFSLLCPQNIFRIWPFLTISTITTLAQTILPGLWKLVPWILPSITNPGYSHTTTRRHCHSSSKKADGNRW